MLCLRSVYHCVPGSLRGQKRVLDSLKVLQMFVSCHVGAGNQTQVCYKSSNHWAISPVSMIPFYTYIFFNLDTTVVSRNEYSVSTKTPWVTHLIPVHCTLNRAPKLSMVAPAAHAFNPITWEAEAGESEKWLGLNNVISIILMTISCWGGNQMTDIQDRDILCLL